MALPPHHFNLHVHLPPNFSAFTTLPEALDLAAAQNVRVLGASNYYDYSIYGLFQSLAAGRGIHAVFGMEVICLEPALRDRGVRINDPGNPGKMYLCGKGLSRLATPPPTSRGAELLTKVRVADAARMARATTALAATFADRGLPTSLTADTIIDAISRRHACPRDTIVLQERHVAQAFQEAAFAVPQHARAESLARLLGVAPKSPDDPVAVQNDIRSCLMKSGKPAFVEETFISFPEARDLVLGLGGYPCYPILADGTSPICPFEADPDALATELLARNIHAAELIPVRNEPAVVLHYARTLRARGIAVSAGTEHNTLDRIPLAPACKGGQAIPPEAQAIFWEGACVAAAHQHLAASDQPGLVDASGNPHIPDAEQRLRHLARVGEQVISATTSR
jgi:hypothetical protein